MSYFNEHEIKWLRNIEDAISSPNGQVDKKLKKQKQWLPYYHSLTPWETCRLMIIASSKNLKTQTYLVVDTAEFVMMLLLLGVDPCKITYVATYKYLGGLVKSYGVTVHTEQFLTWNKPKNMKFDIVIGNPPFNVAGDKGDESNATTGSSSGTGGNSVLYRKFREKALQCIDAGGTLAFISPKNIIKDLHKGGNQIDIVNLMSDNEYWKYNTLYFVERKTPKTHPYVLGGGICSKIFGVEEWDYREFGKTGHRIGKGNITAVTDVPKKASNYQPVVNQVSLAVAAGPKFGFSLLESKKSYMVTDLAFCGDMAACVTVDSMQDAQNLKLFIENNKGLQFFCKNMRLKGLAKDCLRFMKKIDLSQISTGSEYPVEWNLTLDEIAIIEKDFK